MENTKIVDGFIGTPIKPINPAVINSGNRLGTNDTRIIRTDLNIHAMNKAINTIASESDRTRLLIR